MALKCCTGSRIEDLADKLVEELKSERAAGKNPFDFLKVAVANPNLGNWLKMKVLAKVPELSAGVEMPFLEEVLAERVKTKYEGKLELISGRDYPAIVLDALINCWRKEFIPFRKYVKEDDDPKKPDGGVDEEKPLRIKSQREARKAIQLAGRLAELIDGYEATGTLGLLELKKDVNEVFLAEQALVKVLFGGDGKTGLLAAKGKISLRQMFELVRDQMPAAGAGVFMFGQTALTDVQIKILQWVSQSNTVVWYCPDAIEVSATLPSWQESKRKMRQSLKTVFGDSLEIVHVEEADDAISSTCLGAFQSALRGRGEADGLEQDSSLQIVGVPGTRREVEMVYNAILGAVWEKNVSGKPVPKAGMSFSDIAVLVPDMAKYRPVIEAVFEGRGQIPYGLVDTTTQDFSSYLDGFLALMNIARYGLSRKRVFDALENPCVQRAMGISRDEVLNFLDLAQKYGAYNGYKGDGQDSDEHNVSGHFNWEWALRRMRLGLVAVDLKTTKDGSGDRLPLEADDVDCVCRLSEVVETLWRKLDALNHIAEPVECSSNDPKLWEKSWAGRLHAVMDEFLSVDREDSVEALVRAKIVSTLNSLKVIDGPQGYRLPVAMVEHFVAMAESAKGGCLRNGVTIGTLRSLALVPFKQIFVVGLDGTSIPGKADRSTLDVRNELKPEQRLDVSCPEENRARFMEVVLSARERLVLSYPNRELGSDAKLYPSSLVNELKDACKGHVVKGDFREFEGYPLVEFAEPSDTPDSAIKSAVAGETADKCFAGLLPTYSERAYVLAGRKQSAAKVEGAQCALGDIKVQFGKPTPKDLAEFVKDPFTAILKRRLGIGTEGYRDHCVDDASPLGVKNGPVLWKLQEEIAKGKFEEAFSKGQEEANIPCDFLGEFEKSRFDDTVRWAAGIEAEDRALIGDECTASDIRAVVCRRYSKGKCKDPINLPPVAVLEPLFRRLSKCKDGEGPDIEFSVRVINFDKKESDTWRWSLTAKDAFSYYQMVAGWYEKCLMGMPPPKQEKGQDASCPCSLWDKEGRFPAFTYDELRDTIRTVEAIRTDAADHAGSYDWELAAKRLVDKRNDYVSEEKTFNNEPVVGKVVEKYGREPTGEDLKKMFTELFSVPMISKMIVAKEEKGGAE